MEIRKLNAIRGIAALFVVTNHYFFTEEIIKLSWAPLLGQLGVFLFFLLSGFLMSYLYFGKRYSKENILTFMVARFARVYPLYFLVVLLSYISKNVGIADQLVFGIKSGANLFLHLVLLRGMSILWTIPTEIHFYFIFVALWYVYDRAPVLLWGAMITLSVISVVFFINLKEIYIGKIFINVFLLMYFPFFLAGIATGILYKKWSPPLWLKKDVFVFILAAVPIIFFIFSESINNPDMNNVAKYLTMFCLALSVFFVLLFFVPDNNVLLSNKLGDFLGKISFSIYLLHLFVLKAIEPFAQKGLIEMFLIYVVTTLLLSSVMYFKFELPIREYLRSRWKANRQ